MPGGRFDSSRTRVAPFFDYLLARDPTGETWLPKLLALPAHGAGVTCPPGVGTLQDHGWGESERALQPPASLLSWLIRNLRCPSSMKEEHLSPERRDLIRGDPDRIKEGLDLLQHSPNDRVWYVMEGPSYPDAFLATSEAVIVIEGKRTESGPTSKTTWMPVRLQILRHLEAALGLAGPRSLWGFFMVEAAPDGSIPQVWLDACAATLDERILEQSLPHRSAEEREAIAEAFLGVTTWQHACSELGVPPQILPEAVAG